MTPRIKNTRSPLLKITTLFLFWRLGLFAVTFFGSLALPLAANGGLGAIANFKPFDYWLSWAQWDGGYYFNIAKRGYLLLHDFAFFPLYPTLAKIVSQITGDLIFAGLLVSNVSFLLFLLIFYKTTQKHSSREIAINSTVTFLCFPTAFFAIAFYSEGLFLLLTALVFYFLYQNRLLGASFAVLFASLTRTIGIFLILSVYWHYFSQINFQIKKISSKIIIPIIGAFGLAAYSIYLFAKTNSPFLFANTQILWQRSPSDPVSTILGHSWQIITNPNLPPDKYFDLITTLGFLAILILGRKKISSSLWIFSTLVILIPASSATLTSMPRYTLASLGAFVIIGNYLKDHPKLKLPLWGASLALQAILASRFITGYWVA